MAPIKNIPIKPKTELPRQPYTITFMNHDSSRTITVDPNHIPYGATGLPGSILDVALGDGLDLDHACGGVAACSTCHVKVQEGQESCNEASDVELDQLDEATERSLESRLACQCVPDGTKPIVVEVPGWNNNRVKEDQFGTTST